MEEEEETKKLSPKEISARISIDLIWALRRNGTYKNLDQFIPFTNADKGNRSDEELIGRAKKYTQKYLKNKVLHYTWNARSIIPCKLTTSLEAYQNFLHVSPDGRFIVFAEPTPEDTDVKMLLHVFYGKNKFVIKSKKPLSDIKIAQTDLGKYKYNSYKNHYCIRYKNNAGKQVSLWFKNTEQNLIRTKKPIAETFHVKKRAQYIPRILPYKYQHPTVNLGKQSIVPSNTLIHFIKSDSHFGISKDPDDDQIKIYKFGSLSGITGVACALLQLYKEQNNKEGIARTINDLATIKPRPKELLPNPYCEYDRQYEYDARLLITLAKSQKMSADIKKNNKLLYTTNYLKHRINSILFEAPDNVKHAVYKALLVYNYNNTTRLERISANSKFLCNYKHPIKQSETTFCAITGIATDFVWALKKDGNYTNLEQFEKFLTTNQDKKDETKTLYEIYKYAQKQVKNRILHKISKSCRFKKVKIPQEYPLSEYIENLHVSNNGYFQLFIPSAKQKDNKKTLYAQNILKEQIIKKLDTKQITNVHIAQTSKSYRLSKYKVDYTDEYNKKQAIEFHNSNYKLYISDTPHKETFHKKTVPQYTPKLLDFRWTKEFIRMEYNPQKTTSIAPISKNIQLIKSDPSIGIALHDNDIDINLYQFKPLKGIWGVASALLDLYTEQKNFIGIARTIQRLYTLQEGKDTRLLIAHVLNRKALYTIAQDKELLKATKFTQKYVNNAIAQYPENVKTAIRYTIMNNISLHTQKC